MAVSSVSFSLSLLFFLLIIYWIDSCCLFNLQCVWIERLNTVDMASSWWRYRFFFFFVLYIYPIKKNNMVRLDISNLFYYRRNLIFSMALHPSSLYTLFDKLFTFFQISPPWLLSRDCNINSEATFLNIIYDHNIWSPCLLSLSSSETCWLKFVPSLCSFLRHTFQIKVIVPLCHSSPIAMSFFFLVLKLNQFTEFNPCAILSLPFPGRAFGIVV